jgi:hypothetical protein
MRAVIILAAALSLTGCAAGAAAGGAAGGGLATALTINTDADTALKIVKPVNTVLCVVRPFNPKSAEAKAAVDAFCAHLPDSTLGLLPQMLAIIEAVDAAHDTGSP